MWLTSLRPGAGTLRPTLLLSSLALGACGGDPPSVLGDTAGTNGTTGESTGATATTAGTNGTTAGTTGSSGTTATAGTTSGTTGDGSVPFPDGCGGDRYDAEAKQLDMYIMLDESGSMIPWWLPVTEAINAFLDSPDAEGIGVGLQVFGNECSPDHYATPRVPIAPLPDNAAAIRAGLPVAPFSGTATLPAMQGAIQHARGWAMSHPDSKVVVLLVTDGAPDECSSTTENVAQAAAEGFNSSPSIQTYVIGLPLLEPLNPIAAAGGTGQALSADPNDSQALVDTLNAVRGEALPCDYALPADASDTDLVNLRYTSPGGDATDVGRVDGPDQCPTDGRDAWFYDADQRIVACDTTCERLKSEGGVLDVVLGCPTVPLL